MGERLPTKELERSRGRKIIIGEAVNAETEIRTT